MRIPRTPLRGVLAGVLVAGVLAPGLSAQRAPALPAQLDDREFWQLVVDLSEPDGFFEDENYVSNELGYQRSMQRLRDSAAPGGVFIGVGPEQNFAYVAALRPSIAFVLDIRRQNLIQHLLYKALFELADDRADFMSRLFSRPRPAGLDTTSSVQALFQAYAAVKAERRLFEENLAAVLDVLAVRHRFQLTAADRTALQKVFEAFYTSGPDIRYVFRNTAELHPTYAQMMTVADETGKSWSYLSSVEAFEHVRLMQRRNLIVPVVGDFAGPKALRAIGAYVRDRGGAVSVFYVSNVEPYLFTAGTWKAFYDNLLTVPVATDGLFVRSFFGSTSRECSALRPTTRIPVIGAITPLLSAYKEGTLKTQCDLVTASR